MKKTLEKKLTSSVGGNADMRQTRTRAQTPPCDANWINATGPGLLPELTHSQSKPNTGTDLQWLKF